MQRHLDTLIVFSMAVVAACLAFIAWRELALTTLEACLMGLCAFAVFYSMRQTSHDAKREREGRVRVDDLSRESGQLQRDLSLMINRISALEQGMSGKLAEDTKNLQRKFENLEAQFHSLQETHRVTQETITSDLPPLVSLAATLPEEKELQRDVPYILPHLANPSKIPQRFSHMEDTAFGEMIGRAIGAGKIDVHLQPIVTLPQRKVAAYEALARLRNERGELILPSDFMPYAAEAGLLPTVDNFMFFRSVQIIRKLESRNRDAGMFTNISLELLADGPRFREFLDFAEANAALATNYYFEIAQADLQHFGALEREALLALRKLGYRFSLDRVENLRIEPQPLAELGFAYVKISSDLLLGRGSYVESDIHPSDLSNLLMRYGIDLVADKVESEGTVVDLLDYNIRFGQGFLFAPPRPVRSDVMAEGTSFTRNDAVEALSAGVAPAAVSALRQMAVAAQQKAAAKQSASESASGAGFIPATAPDPLIARVGS